MPRKDLLPFHLARRLVVKGIGGLWNYFDPAGTAWKEISQVSSCGFGHCQDSVGLLAGAPGVADPVVPISPRENFREMKESDIMHCNCFRETAKGWNHREWRMPDIRRYLSQHSGEDDVLPAKTEPDCARKGKTMTGESVGESIGWSFIEKDVPAPVLIDVLKSPQQVMGVPADAGSGAAQTPAIPGNSHEAGSSRFQRLILSYRVRRVMPSSAAALARCPPTLSSTCRMCSFSSSARV